MNERELLNSCAEACNKLITCNSVVASITNAVTVNLVANTQLAVGASAAMVYMDDEIDALMQVASSCYLNMGTLLPVHADSMVQAMITCHDLEKPYVIDPVGLGIGAIRDHVLRVAQTVPPAIIRGNASEIIGLARLWELDVKKHASHTAGASGASAASAPRGVDSVDTVDDALPSARALAAFTHGAVIISGEHDIVTDGTHTAFLLGGSPFMPLVTGMGCSQGGIAAAYAAVADPFVAALCTSALYKAAGMEVHDEAHGPASFQTLFVDALYKITRNDPAASFESVFLRLV